jgi:hypothetical protein
MLLFRDVGHNHLLNVSFRLLFATRLPQLGGGSLFLTQFSFKNNLTILDHRITEELNNHNQNLKTTLSTGNSLFKLFFLFLIFFQLFGVCCSIISILIFPSVHTISLSSVVLCIELVQVFEFDFNFSNGAK